MFDCFTEIRDHIVTDHRALFQSELQIFGRRVAATHY